MTVSQAGSQVRWIAPADLDPTRWTPRCGYALAITPSTVTVPTLAERRRILHQPGPVTRPRSASRQPADR
jgi:hypothetical protein